MYKRSKRDKSKPLIGQSSGSTIHDELIVILEKITGSRWGYIKKRQRVQCLTSELIPIRVIVFKGAPYEQSIKVKDSDITVLATGYVSEYWEDIVTTELVEKLFSAIEKLTDIAANVKKTAIDIMKAWRPSREFAELVNEARVQRERYPSDPADTIYDGWADACVEITPGITGI